MIWKITVDSSSREVGTMYELNKQTNEQTNNLTKLVIFQIVARNSETNLV
jgi:hypothetical protein